MHRVHRHHPQRRRALAAAVATLFVANAAYANVYVDNCNDSGGGSLRSAVANAVNGDVVDMSALTCSKITLTSGAIVIHQNFLQIFGPGVDKLSITGKYNSTTVEDDRIFEHDGNGALTLADLAVRYGAPATQDKGGCIYSRGNVELYGVKVSHCTLQGSYASGGGVFAGKALNMIYSSITFSGIDAQATPAALGGGAFVTGDFTATSSTIANNFVTGTGCHDRQCSAGGVFVEGNTRIVASTLSGNQATFAGALYTWSSDASTTTALYQTTVSGNYAAHLAGGIYTNNASVTLVGDTIAFNSAGIGISGSDYVSPGVASAGNVAPTAVALTDSLLTNNTYGFAIENDFSTISSAAAPVTVSGSNNFVRVSWSSLPDFTITGKCVDIGPLADNGGPTRTHRLFSGSPARDAGKNFGGFTFDQRGANYFRIAGAVQDIGAFEVQDDVIFAATFNPCD